MKAGMILKRISVLGAAALVGMLMAGVVGNAATTLTTPNSTTYNFSLAAGGTSASITPPVNTGVLVLGTNTTTTNFSVSSANLVHVSGSQIRWVGLESSPSALVVHGASSTPGVHVVYLDYAHQVDLEILSADALVVHNKSTSTQTGNVKLIW